MPFDSRTITFGTVTRVWDGRDITGSDTQLRIAQMHRAVC